MLRTQNQDLFGCCLSTVPIEQDYDNNVVWKPVPICLFWYAHHWGYCYYDQRALIAHIVVDLQQNVRL